VLISSLAAKSERRADRTGVSILERKWKWLDLKGTLKLAAAKKAQETRPRWSERRN
jgi:hypothetical protein